MAGVANHLDVLTAGSRGHNSQVHLAQQRLSNPEDGHSEATSTSILSIYERHPEADISPDVTALI